MKFNIHIDLTRNELWKLFPYKKKEILLDFVEHTNI